MKSLIVFVSLTVALGSPDATTVDIFTSEDCTGDATATIMVDSEVPFMSMCNGSPMSDIISIEISPGTSLAAYWSCRSGLTPEAADMDFDRIITAPSATKECIKIVHRDEDSERALTFQLVENITSVCFEYARTAARFCDMDECSEECEIAVNAMRQFGADSNCAGVDVSTVNYGMDKKKKGADQQEPFFMVKPATRVGLVHGGQGGFRPHNRKFKTFKKQRNHDGDGDGSEHHWGDDSDSDSESESSDSNDRDGDHHGHRGGRNGHRNGHHNDQSGASANQQSGGSNTQQGNAVASQPEHVCFYRLQHDLEEITAECEEGRFILFILSTLFLSTSVASCVCLCRSCKKRPNRRTQVFAPVIIASPDMQHDGDAVQAIVMTRADEFVSVKAV